MKNQKKINNNGLSLVELIISVTILSLIMIGMGAILSSMTRNFSLSQTEIALQDSVQSTYSIVSNLIQEAQTETAQSTEQVVDSHSTTNRTVIKSNNTKDKQKAQYYVIEFNSDKKILYLTHGNMYTKKNDTGNDEQDYTVNSLPSSEDVQEQYNILATDVTAFEVDDSNYEDGYIIVGLKCEKRGRSASITQNVYLRNSNVSAEWGKNQVKTMEGFDSVGYRVTAITNKENTVKKYAKGADVEKKHFILKGTFVKDTEPKDTKYDQTIGSTAYTIYSENKLTPEGTLDPDKIVTKIEKNMTVYFVFNDGTEYYFPDNNSMDLEVIEGGSVSSNDPTDPKDGPGLTTPSDSSANSNAGLEVSYVYKEPTDTLTPTIHLTGDGYIGCRKCKEKLVKSADYNEYYKAYAHQDPDSSSCPNKYNGLIYDGVDTADVAYMDPTGDYKCRTGEGVITIQNVGDEKIKTAEVVLYIEGLGAFYRSNTTDKFVDFKTASSSGIGASYTSSALATDLGANYIDVKIDNLIKNGDSRKGDQLKIIYKWAIPVDDYNAGVRPKIAVFKESYIKQN
ncbi:MAG: prepilin-type N-terminal cleavage/methylation domain-containing protein [Lachnospiraceae bacterium]|nr:prepilin-type N-terminal cleavage/methylation domain-containing protein [Lachnospiraceae bacterium]